MTVALRVRTSEGEPDAYGDPTTIEATEPIPGAFLGSPASGDTATLGRDGVTVSFRLYMPHGFDITRHDQVDVDGERFRIIGEIIRRESPFTGWQAGQWCLIGRGEG